MTDELRKAHEADNQEKRPAPDRQQTGCHHDFQATDNGLIDRCTKCGEERA